MKGNWAAAPTQQPVLIIICWSVAWAMINDSVRVKTKHSASYLQSTCSCGPIGREWKRVEAAHGLIMGKRRELEKRKGEMDKEERGEGGLEGLPKETYWPQQGENNFKRHNRGIHIHTHIGIYKGHCQSLNTGCYKFYLTFKIKIIPDNPTGIYSLSL